MFFVCFLHKGKIMKSNIKHKMTSPRNPFVVVSLFKKSGVHCKSNKALRRKVKVMHQRNILDRSAYLIDSDLISISCKRIASHERASGTAGAVG
jgi:hypothetical protein